MSNIEALDAAERMIIFALEGSKPYAKNVVVGGGFKDKKRGMSCVQLDAGELLNFSEMSPSSMYAPALEIGADRLFTTDKSFLTRHPADIIGERNEIAFLHNDTMKWIGMRRMLSNKNIYALRSVCCWYEFHYRCVLPSGLSNYFRRVVAFTDAGDVSPVMTRNGNIVVCSSDEARSAIVLASVIEDAHRAKTMLATVADEGEIKFAVPLDDYKSMFIGRHAPMKNGRRMSIIHWVASHLRRKKDGDSTRVKKHVRGVDKIEIDGLKISITPNDIGSPRAAS